VYHAQEFLTEFFMCLNLPKRTGKFLTALKQKTNSENYSHLYTYIPLCCINRQIIILEKIT